MRLFLAALIILGGTILAAVVLGFTGIYSHVPVPVSLITWLILFFIMIALTSRLFSWWEVKDLSKEIDSAYSSAPEETLEQLEAKDLITETTYRAVRALRVAEDEDEYEGPHYFVELKDRSVLHLRNERLYDLEGSPNPGEGDNKEHKIRRFPCTEFDLRRHKAAGTVAAIECRGEVFEPEVEEQFFLSDFYDDWAAEDGQIVSNLTYDEVREKIRIGYLDN